ncbi:alpha/beta hydrolase [Lactiplantibacillus carotarum]|uniref:alpha/beta hydrolase n=1 Tax=Lactiplantibacillus carotarum TaxID=2993456 RepID=UPI00298F27BD|nr:alpha/beta hydrolase family protein [Lactiplantibacillus carotarum]
MALLSMNYYSNILGHDTDVTVAIPDEKTVTDFSITATTKRYPVLYLLHGVGDNASGWARFTNVERYASESQFIVVMPTAEHSFYRNAVNDKRWYDYFQQELPYRIARWFPVDDQRRFVAGISMGGYGAWLLGLTQPDRYQGIAGISSVVSLEHLKTDAPSEMRPIFDQVYHTVFGSADPRDDQYGLKALITPELCAQAAHLPLLLQYEGQQDFMYADNQAFKNLCLAKGLPLHYEEWAGAHEWDFWDSAIRKTLRTFSEMG